MAGVSILKTAPEGSFHSFIHVGFNGSGGKRKLRQDRGVTVNVRLEDLAPNFHLQLPLTFGVLWVFYIFYPLLLGFLCVFFPYSCWGLWTEDVALLYSLYIFINNINVGKAIEYLDIKTYFSTTQLSHHNLVCFPMYWCSTCIQ